MTENRRVVDIFTSRIFSCGNSGNSKDDFSGEFGGFGKCSQF
jgi:hypothetical protein